MAETLENIFAQQPETLAGPVPTDPVKESLQDILAQSQATPDIDPPQGMQVSEPPVEPFAPEPQSLEGQSIDVESGTSVSEQVREFWPRMQAAWAGNTREAARVLVKSGKFDDVRIDPQGTLKVKRPGDSGFTSFDRDDFEIIGDLIDVSRMGTEMAVETGMEAAGTLGLAAAAPETGGASLAAQPALGAASAVTALTVGDAIAEKLLDVERDPERSGTQEKAIAGAFGAGFNFASASLARRMATKKSAARQAQVGIDKVAADVQDAAGEQRILEEAGIKFNTDEGTAVLTPSQATGGRVPELVLTERELTKQPGYRNYIEKRGEELVDSWTTLTDTLQKKTLGKLSAGKEFKERFKGIGDYFGEGIGQFRTLAKQSNKGQKVSPERFREKIDDLFFSNEGQLKQATEKESTGIFDAAGKAIKKDGKQVIKTKNPAIESLLINYPGLTEGQAKVISSELGRYKKRLSKGDLSVAEIDSIYNSLRRRIDSAMNTTNGQAVGHFYVDMKNAIRDDYAEIIGNLVPENQRAAYESFMQNYSVFKQGETELRNVIKQSDISKKAMVAKLFDNNTALPKARALKVVLDQEDPALFRELTNEYFHQMRVKNTAGPKGKEVVNWSGMARQWRKLGDEMQQILLDGSGLTRKQMDSMLNLGQKYQSVDIKNLSEEGVNNLVRDLWIASPVSRAGGAAQANAWESLAKRVGKGLSLAEYLKDGGAEQFLKKFPSFKGAKRSRFLKWVDNLKTTSPTTPGGQAATAGTKAAIRSGVRQDTTE